MASCFKLMILGMLLTLLSSCGQNGGEAPGVNTGVDTEVSNCEGVDVGGFCWYLGASNQSCALACTNHGGYNTATETYAGSVGTDANCIRVLDALDVANVSLNTSNGCFNGFGCTFDVNFVVRTRCANLAATPSAAAGGLRRACACNE